MKCGDLRRAPTRKSSFIDRPRGTREGFMYVGKKRHEITILLVFPSQRLISRKSSRKTRSSSCVSRRRPVPRWDPLTLFCLAAAAVARRIFVVCSSLGALVVA